MCDYPFKTYLQVCFPCEDGNLLWPDRKLQVAILGIPPSGSPRTFLQCPELCPGLLLIRIWQDLGHYLEKTWYKMKAAYCSFSMGLEGSCCVFAASSGHALCEMLLRHSYIQHPWDRRQLSSPSLKHHSCRGKTHCKATALKTQKSARKITIGPRPFFQREIQPRLNYEGVPGQ